MKKTLLTLLVILTILPCFAQAVSEINTEEITVKLGVMQGPTGFSSSALGDIAQIEVYPSPNEAVAKLIKSELDMIALPANAAASLYNKGVGIKVVAIIGEGMLSVVGTESATNTTSTTTTLYVPGTGGTPDHMASLLYPEYEKEYSVTAPAQLAQLLIAGKVDLAILPEPFVTMVLSKNSNLKIISNVQERWTALTGQDNYPMSVLVVKDSFAQEHPSTVQEIKEAYKNSIETILSDPETAGARIEELGIMKAEMATPALANCALTFKDGSQAKKELLSYYTTLLSLAPDAIGSKLPDDGLWL